MTAYQRIPVVDKQDANSHRRLSQAVNYLLDIIDHILRVTIETALLRGNTGTYANLATLINWTGSAIGDEPTTIQADPVAGTITIGKTGWYSVEIYSFSTGSNNNAQYGLQMVNSAGPTFIAGALTWDNNNPGMVFSSTISLLLNAGDILSLQALASAGTLTFTQASFAVFMQQE